MSIQALGQGRVAWGLGVLALSLAIPSAASAQNAEAGKVPITTASPEALKLYLEGRDLNERLRATDGYAVLEKAVAKDKEFAMGHLALANSAPSAKAFFDSLQKAVALAGKASEGERLMILGLDAGVKSRPEVQLDHYKKLTAAFPNDERAHNLLGGLYFGQQNYEQAIAEYQKAIAINPSFSQPYNQLGYAQRFLGRNEDAEKSFKKYIELIPGDPNPYDSYAELLMKTGRFDESIAQYRKALSINPNFVNSYLGIGINQTLQGKPAEARATFAKLGEAARNSGEKRLALTQTAWSWVDEGQTDKAIESVKAMYAIAEKEGDGAAMSGDCNLMGNILLEAGRLDEAGAQFARTIEVIEKANVPADVKEAVKRNHLFDETRIALAKGDLATARARSAAYATQVAAKNVPFEVRQSHHAAGLVATADKDYAKAIAELQKANQLDPRVPYALALAYRGKGDAGPAKEFCRKAAEDNGLNFNLAYVRTKARKMLGTL
jgi:tetratricopeptide (TPR) repeat protein